MSETKTIILCATQRSGSTLLCQDMAVTQKLGHPQEYFINFVKNKRIRRLGRYWHKRLDEFRADVTPNGVFSVKVMANQVPFINQRLLDGSQNLDGTNIFHAFHDALQDAHWVYLKRDDVLKQAISRVILNQSQVAHAVKADAAETGFGRKHSVFDDSYNAAVEYRAKATRNLMDRIERENQFWEIFFATFGIKPVRISYEDYCRDPQPYLSRIAEGVGETVIFNPDARAITKLANEKNAEFYQRFSSDFLRNFRQTCSELE